MITPVPALSQSNWVTNTTEKADLLLSHFFESDKAQSYIYGSSIANLQGLIEKYGHNADELCSKMQDTLEIYLKKYYPAVVVNVSHTVDKQKPSEIILKLYCRAAEENKEIIFGKLLRVADTKIAKIMSLNNTGEAI